MESKHILNRKSLKPLRSSLRNNSTSAEAVLWNKLKSKNLDGRKFRRQHSIGKYIVDFYCPSEKLIIELDGDPHGNPVQVWKDTIRDKYAWIHLLRFENRFVFQEPELVLKEKKKFFQTRLE